MSELLARLAGELGERVTVRIETVDGGEGEYITLLPRNPAAATVTVEHDPDGDDEQDELWLTIADDGGEPADLRQPYLIRQPGQGSSSTRGISRSRLPAKVKLLLHGVRRP